MGAYIFGDSLPPSGWKYTEDDPAARKAWEGWSFAQLEQVAYVCQYDFTQHPAWLAQALRQKAADYMALAGWGPGLTRATEKDDEGNWLPRVDIYAALARAAGLIGSGPDGWAYGDREDPRWDLVRLTYKSIQEENPVEHFPTWEAEQPLAKILAALRG